MPYFALALLILLSAFNYQAAWAQDVYRCESSYSPEKCASNTTALDVRDVRTKEQKKDADQSTRKMRVKANALEKARLKEEAAARAEAKRTLSPEAKAQAILAAKEKAKAKARARYKAKKEAEALVLGQQPTKAKKPKMFVAKVIKPAKN